MTPTLKTFVTFQSELFNNTEERDYFVNPDCFGDDFCKFMEVRLQAVDIECGNLSGEDWGWSLDVKFRGVTFIFRTNYHGDAFWFAYVESDQPLWEQLFNRPKKDVPMELTKAIHDILFGTEGIDDIRWFTSEQFDRGAYSDGSPVPE